MNDGEIIMRLLIPPFVLAFGLRLLPDAIRIMRHQEPKDPVTVNGFARRFADFGEHWKKEPQPWIYILVTLFFVFAGGYGTCHVAVMLISRIINR